jgi:hypothetical protein
VPALPCFKWILQRFPGPLIDGKPESVAKTKEAGGWIQKPGGNVLGDNAS